MIVTFGSGPAAPELLDHYVRLYPPCSVAATLPTKTSAASSYGFPGPRAAQLARAAGVIKIDSSTAAMTPRR